MNAECAVTAQCVEVALVTCNWVLEKHLSVISMFIVNVVNGQRDQLVTNAQRCPFPRRL